MNGTVDTLFLVSASLRCLDRLWGVHNTWVQRLPENMRALYVMADSPKLYTELLLNQTLSRSRPRTFIGGQHPYLEHGRLIQPQLRDIMLLRDVPEYGSQSITRKTLRSFQFVNDALLREGDTTIRWLVKADDDTYVVPRVHRRLYEHLDCDELHLIGYGIWHEGLPWAPHLQHTEDRGYAAGGPSYVLSRALVRYLGHFGVLAKCLQDYDESIGEDTAFGMCLHRSFTVVPYGTPLKQVAVTDGKPIIYFHHSRQLNYRPPSLVVSDHHWDLMFRGYHDSLPPATIHKVQQPEIWNLDYALYALADA